MKKIFLTAWAAICTGWAGIGGSLYAFAEEQTERAAKVMLTMDVLQKVCLGIVITAVVLLLIFRIAKAVLKKLHVVPVEKGQKNDNEQE